MGQKSPLKRGKLFFAVLMAGVLSSSVLPPGGTPASAAIAAPNLVWTRTTQGIVRESSPTVANLDGENDVIVGSRDGNVYALKGSDGSNVNGWPKNTGDPIDSSPSVADTNRDGKNEVFIGSGYGGARSGNMWSFSNDGGLRWKFHPSDNDFSSLSVFSSPALGEVTGDGIADVSSFALGLLGWSFNESGVMNKGWPYYQDDTVFSSPALFDVDGDGQTDYVVGGDSSPGPPIDHRGGFIRALRGDGTLIWKYELDEMGRSSPAIGDIDGDGQPEIVVGTGDYWYRQPGGAHDSNKIFVLNRNGTLKWSKTLTGFSVASPALADVNGDGKLDVIEPTWGGDDQGRVFVFDGAGNTLPNWAGRPSGGGIVLGQVSTADFDNDGGQDIAINTGGGVFVASGKTGANLFSLRAGASAYQNSPWIGDMDNDGKLDIVIAGALPGDTDGIIQRYEMPTTTAKLGSLNWSQFRKDNRLTGSWIPTDLYTDYCERSPGEGYRLVARDGGVFSYCGSEFKGSMGGQKLNAPMVGMAKTPSDNGYWTVASDGGIFSFGDADFWGSTGSIKLNAPIVGMAPTPSGKGYWLVAADGGVFNYGDAGFFGSAGSIKLNAPIVGMAPTADGRGYWLAAADGGIFNYGNAPFLGSAGSLKLNAPVVGMAPTANGAGYWMVGADGGIFTYGNAGFIGSTGSMKLNKPIVGMARGARGGYRFVASDGGVFSYGAQFLGSEGGRHLNQPIVGMSS